MPQHQAQPSMMLMRAFSLSGLASEGLAEGGAGPPAGSYQGLSTCSLGVVHMLQALPEEEEQAMSPGLAKEIAEVTGMFGKLDPSMPQPVMPQVKLDPPMPQPVMPPGKLDPPMPQPVMPQGLEEEPETPQLEAHGSESGGENAQDDQVVAVGDSEAEEPSDFESDGEGESDGDVSDVWQPSGHGEIPEGLSEVACARISRTFSLELVLVFEARLCSLFQ